jgi:hypothetical protein
LSQSNDFLGPPVSQWTREDLQQDALVVFVRQKTQLLNLTRHIGPSATRKVDYTQDGANVCRVYYLRQLISRQFGNFGW